MRSPTREWDTPTREWDTPVFTPQFGWLPGNIEGISHGDLLVYWSEILLVCIQLMNQQKGFQDRKLLPMYRDGLSWMTYESWENVVVTGHSGHWFVGTPMQLHQWWRYQACRNKNILQIYLKIPKATKINKSRILKNNPTNFWTIKKKHDLKRQTNSVTTIITNTLTNFHKAYYISIDALKSCSTQILERSQLAFSDRSMAPACCRLYLRRLTKFNGSARATKDGTAAKRK